MRQRGIAIFIGAPSICANPFQRIGISQARSVILFRAWLAGEATPGVLRCAHFSEAEIAALERRLPLVLKAIDQLRGRDIRCSCATGSAWCHGDVLLARANRSR